MNNRHINSTMKDVAKLAGVSQPTVSYVINGTAPVSEEVTKRVLKAIEELHYVPNMVAKSLKQKRTDIVAFLIPDIDSSYYSELAKGVEETLRESGYITFLCNTLYNIELEALYIKNLIQHKVEGIVIGYGLMKEELYQEIYKYNIPFVVLDDHTNIGREEIPSVETDNIKGSSLAVEHLHHVGAKNICFASEPLFNRTLKLRFEGFKLAMERLGHSISDDRVFIETMEYNKFDMGYSIGAKIFINKEIDAVFASSDNLAIGILKRFEELNVSVPEEVIIIGYDDIPLARLVTPTLTSVAQPKQPMGQKGVELLVKMIKGEKIIDKRIMLDPSLIIRKSTMKTNKSKLETI